MKGGAADMRVLVVEDERDLNRILTKTLSKAGYSVDGCLNGEEMADHLLGAEYDAILMDVMMPGWNCPGHLDAPAVFLHIV